MHDPFFLNIGDIVFSVQLNHPDYQQNFESMYAGFIDTGNPDVDLTIQVNWGNSVHQNGWRLVFDTQKTWSLWQQDDRWAIRMNSPVMDPANYQTIVLDSAFSMGEIYPVQQISGRYIHPFQSQFAQLLTVNLLARGRGLLLHSCALIDQDIGRLFVGVSGAGKSTMARLWSQLPGVQLLNDDRVILRQREGTFWIFGTPWHGDVRIVSSQARPIQQIFILKHADGNYVRRLSPAEASASLLVRAFPTYWYPEGMVFTLDFLAQLSQQLPCYELGFIPDPDVVEFVRCVKSD